MSLPRLSCFVLAIAVLSPVSRAHAQPRTEPQPPSKISLDLGFGGGRVQHDAYAMADGIQAEALLAARLASRRGQSLIFAANGFAKAVGFGDDLECRIYPDAGSQCVERLRLTPNAALLVGAELRRHGAALRMLAGPIRYTVEDASSRTGTHVRLDLAVPASSRIAFVVATRMSYVGRIRGEAIEIFSMSGGMRLQR